MIQTEMIRVHRKFKEQLEETKKEFEKQIKIQISLAKYTQLLAESYVLQPPPLFFYKEKNQKKGT